MNRASITQGEPSSAGTPPIALDRRRSVNPARRHSQELWFLLARRGWRSLALVPADAGGSATETAISLAEVGRLLHEPVDLVVTPDTLDYASAAEMVAAVGSKTEGAGPRPVEPPRKVIAALQPVVTEPLGLAIAEAVDTVVLCVDLGRTRFASALRTIELVGRDRIAGCLLVR